MLEDYGDSITWHPYQPPKNLACLSAQEYKEDLLNYLDKNIFSQSKDRTGAAKTYLNINCFRELMEVVRLSLGEEEQSSLVDYNLQVLLIELAQIRTSQGSVDEVLKTVLFELRRGAHYWIEGSRIHEEIKNQRSLWLMQRNLKNRMETVLIMVLKKRLNTKSPERRSTLIWT